MEIIKKGETPKYKIMCSNCKTVFIGDYKDILHKEVETIIGIKLKQGYFVCPVCSIKITFNNFEDLNKFKIKNKEV